MQKPRHRPMDISYWIAEILRRRTFFEILERDRDAKDPGGRVVAHYDQCPICRGRGKVSVWDDCSRCKGEGLIKVSDPPETA